MAVRGRLVRSSGAAASVFEGHIYCYMLWFVNVAGGFDSTKRGGRVRAFTLCCCNGDSVDICPSYLLNPPKCLLHSAATGYTAQIWAIARYF
jgi:hypothetical protein